MMWNNHFSIITKANENTSSTEVACSEASSTQFEDTFEFKKPYPPPLGRTYSRLRSLVERPVKRSSPSRKIHFRPSPGLNGSDSLPEFPTLRRSKAISLPRRSFPAPVPTKSSLNDTAGTKRQLEFSSSNDDNERNFLSSFSAGHEMEICYNDTSSEETCKAMTKNEFPIPTLISSEVTRPVFQPRSPPQVRVLSHEMDSEDGNNNETLGEEYQWPEEQLDPSHHDRGALRFEKRNTTDLVFKELQALENGKSSSMINVRAWLEDNIAGFSFSALGEQGRLKGMVCDRAEGEGVAIREGHKDKIDEEIKEIEDIGKIINVDKVKD